ncbi:MAG: hypothetical protein NVSMB31_01270 [Vulcanimicrobiaceae bacterium]
MPNITDTLRMGRAQVAVLAAGDTWDVFRLSALSPPSGVLDGAPIISQYRAKLERMTTKTNLDNQVFDLLTYAGKSNVSALQLGDLIRNTQIAQDVYCFCQVDSTQPDVFMRCEFSAIIKRPIDATSPPSENLPPLTGWVLGAGTSSAISQETEASALPLTQQDGGYLFGSSLSGNSTPVIVPIGIQPTTRARPGRTVGLPSDTPVERFTGYIPPLFDNDGDFIAIKDNDEIEVQGSNNEVYVVEQVYSSGFVGLVGTVVLLSKSGV